MNLKKQEKKCPRCNSSNIEIYSEKEESGKIIKTIKCNHCFYQDKL